MKKKDNNFILGFTLIIIVSFILTLGFQTIQNEHKINANNDNIAEIKKVMQEQAEMIYKNEDIVRENKKSLLDIKKELYPDTLKKARAIANKSIKIKGLRVVDIGKNHVEFHTSYHSNYKRYVINVTDGIITTTDR